MTVKWNISAAFGVIVLFLTACSTHTETPPDPLADVPPPDELRFISMEDATSQCIGNPKTPLCAVETLLACFTRVDPSLCQMVGVTNKYLKRFKKITKYKVLTARELTAEEIERENATIKYEDSPEFWSLGFVEIVITQPDGEDGTCSLRDCKFVDSPPPVGDECCKYTYIIKPIGNEWRPISWWWWGEY